MRCLKADTSGRQQGHNFPARRQYSADVLLRVLVGLRLLFRPGWSLSRFALQTGQLLGTPLRHLATADSELCKKAIARNSVRSLLSPAATQVGLFVLKDSSLTRMNGRVLGMMWLAAFLHSPWNSTNGCSCCTPRSVLDVVAPLTSSVPNLGPASPTFEQRARRGSP